MPWTDTQWEPLVLQAPRIKVTLAPSEGVVLPAKGPWGRSPQTEFTLTADPEAEAPELPQFLYSPAKPAERTTPVFRFKTVERAAPLNLYGLHNAAPYREDADTSRPLSPYAASKKAAAPLPSFLMRYIAISAFWRSTS